MKTLALTGHDPPLDSGTKDKVVGRHRRRRSQGYLRNDLCISGLTNGGIIINIAIISIYANANTSGPRPLREECLQGIPRNITAIKCEQLNTACNRTRKTSIEAVLEDNVIYSRCEVCDDVTIGQAPFRNNKLVSSRTASHPISTGTTTKHISTSATIDGIAQGTASNEIRRICANDILNTDKRICQKRVSWEGHYTRLKIGLDRTSKKSVGRRIPPCPTIDDIKAESTIEKIPSLPTKECVISTASCNRVAPCPALYLIDPTCRRASDNARGNATRSYHIIKISAKDKSHDKASKRTVRMRLLVHHDAPGKRFSL